MTQEASVDIGGLCERIARALARSDGVPDDASTGDYLRNAQDLLAAIPELAEASALQTRVDELVGVLEQIAAGSKLGTEMFEKRVHERKDRLTWYAVNVLQDSLAACQGTAERALIPQVRSPTGDA